MAKKKNPGLLLLTRVHQTILLLRGQRIILDADLARLYGVTTKRLNQQVARNIDRFPEDFMFRLTWDEAQSLRSQIATLDDAPLNPRLQIATLDLSRRPPSSRSKSASLRSGANLKYRPYAFTEHGAIMAATVLNSKEAVKASLFVVRAFVQLRELLSTHHDLAAKLDELEKKLQNHDEQILAIIDAIRQLMEDPDAADPAKPPIGFHTELASPNATATSPKRLPKPKAKAK
ncbi:MAG TPA: ORF6N domain-containing protein [Phycisphaerae bacterium]|nr:ORF6N domain-containing protein [Phycisphaerae bacterium]